MPSYTIKSSFTAGFKTRGSLFEAHIIPCRKKDSADLHLEDIKGQHSTATHHCYAFRIGLIDTIEFSHNDGEPPGTAGTPILNSPKSANLVRVICFVVRYYGGVKLGKSGLSEAYGNAANLVIQKSILHEIVPTIRYTMIYKYDQQSLIDKLKHTFTLYDIKSEYTENIKWVFECPGHLVESFETKIKSVKHLFISFEKEKDSSYILS